MMLDEGAIQAFKERKSRKPNVSYEDYKARQEEIKRLESIILEHVAEIALFKKKNR